MPTAQALLGYITTAVTDSDGAIDPCTLSWIYQLQEIINDRIPEQTVVRLFNVYKFWTKKYGWMRGVVTKENGKTWVIYETTDSRQPGCRWTWGKDGCSKDVMQRDTAQSYEMPSFVTFK